MASKLNNKNPLRDLTPTEADLDDNHSSSTSSSASGETLREKASKKLHGPNANPSQLGDPISLKAETSEHVPKPAEAGARGNNSTSSATESTSAQTASSSSSPSGGETLREKATKKLNGPNANPSQLGDPISLKAETSDNVPAPSEAGASKGKRSSRL
ncbi:hypothetical protein N0V93_002719 [Gnomoniopsis smithogilvyi]|uniref:Uncharacterized protein n=1 Tax=Gnomoniopsis smithogilvyi TaxID=1191159 RepID=A0A9W9CZ83_9PEZI|nr:hypothetical protein N0V93_002719 [Gnomoniopsis smithogilvyi]